MSMNIEHRTSTMRFNIFLTYASSPGGAQAIAAMAYGTESVPKVDKICGPGNQFVTTAKMLVQNDSSAFVSIDMPAGPSEIMVSGSTCQSDHQKSW